MIVMGSSPVLTTWTLSAGLVVFAAWFWKVRVPGAKLSANTAAVPVPLRLRDCVPASSTTFMVAVRAPVAVGVNVTLMEQVRAGVTVVQKLLC